MRFVDVVTEEMKLVDVKGEDAGQRVRWRKVSVCRPP